VFISSDSGDFLAASTAWMVPQTYGYPLYTLLGHLVGFMFHDLEAAMNIVLSALPAAIAIGLVFATVLRMTGKYLVALISAAVLLGCAIFLTEASVTKGYALEAMFLTAAFYTYVCGRKKSTLVFLGLATAVHITAAFVAVFWLLADRRWKYWLSSIWIYIIVGLVPYLMVPILMYLDTPRFLAGSLTFENLKNYFSSTSRAIVGTISIFEAPERVFWIGKIVLMSFGLGLVPLIVALRRPLGRRKLLLIATGLFFLWYVVTCLDAQTWTYLSLGAPSMAILIGLGLNRLQRMHWYAVGVSACLLISFNAAFLNASLIDAQRPYGRNYMNTLESLPDRAVVVTEPGPYSLGLFYHIVQGSNLVPLVYPYIEQPLFNVADYNVYLHEHYTVWKTVDKLHQGYNPITLQPVPIWQDTLQGIQWCLDYDVPVYFTVQELSPITRCFELSGGGDVQRIVGLTGEEPDLYLREVSYK